MKHWRLLAVAASEGRMTPERWLVTCSCGWERECSSEWAAHSVSKLHPQLGPTDVDHATRIEGPANSSRGAQLTLEGTQ